MDEATFARQLFQGLGRPYLHLQQDGAAPYRAALLRTCIVNPVYDRQCEGSRTGYLLGLLRLTGELPWYRRQILDALGDPPEEADLDQLLEFAARFAREGDAEARRLLYERAAEQLDADERAGATQIIDLDGLDGFVFVAERLGAVAARDLDFIDDAWLRSYLVDGREGILEQLQALRRERPLLDRYLEAVEGNSERRMRAKAERVDIASLPYAELRALLERHPREGAPSSIRRWAEPASDAALREAARALLDITDVPLLRAHLAIFRRRMFPLAWGQLAPLVRHEDDRVGRAALTALGQLHDPGVRQLGIALLDEGFRVHDALELFMKNYRPEDDVRFAALIDAAEDDDALHAAGVGLVDISRANPTPAATPLLRQLYERGPCSLCREDVVQLLLDAGTLPAELASECAHDANENTRALVAHQE